MGGRTHDWERDQRLTQIAWALFLIMIGGFLLVPDERLPQGAWLIGLGAILLGLNGVRLIVGLRIGWVTTVLGTLALMSGLSDYAGVDVPVGPALLIIIGAAVILRNLEGMRQAR